MQTRRFNDYEEGITVEMEPLRILAERLEYLNQFLKHLREEKPEILGGVVEDLQVTLDGLVSSKEKYSKIQIPNVRMDLDVLSNYPRLLKISKAAVLFFMNFSEYKGRNMEKKTEIKLTDTIRTWFLPYYIARSLARIMPRKEAIQYYQSIVDSIIEETSTPDDHIETIDELRRVNWEWLETVKSTNFIEFISEGIFGIKTIVCIWAEVFKELNDPKLAEAVTCYRDFQMTKNLNENFVLTRTQTLVGGKDYCDACIHDIRIVKKIKHRPKEFWKNLT